MADTSTREVKLWILEHACKHQMNSVIQAIIKDGADYFYKWMEACKNEWISPVHQTFMSVLLLRTFLSSLEAITTPFVKKDIYIFSKNFDLELLDIIIEILEEIYKQQHLISLKLFVSISTRLKMMELLILINQGKKCGSVIEKVKNYFPKENEKFREKLIYLNIEDPVNMERVQQNNAMCRRLVLRLLANASYRKKYMSTCYERDMKEFLSFIYNNLKSILKNIEHRMAPSAIEKILSGAGEDLVYSEDPAIQLLLEYLHPNLTERDLLAVLYALDPEPCSQGGALPILNCLDELNEADELNRHEEDVLGDSGLWKRMKNAESNIAANDNTNVENDARSDTTELILAADDLDTSPCLLPKTEIVEDTDEGGVYSPCVKGNSPVYCA